MSLGRCCRFGPQRVDLGGRVLGAVDGAPDGYLGYGADLISARRSQEASGPCVMGNKRTWVRDDSPGAAGMALFRQIGKGAEPSPISTQLWTRCRIVPPQARGDVRHATASPRPLPNADRSSVVQGAHLSGQRDGLNRLPLECERLGQQGLSCLCYNQIG